MQLTTELNYSLYYLLNYLCQNMTRLNIRDTHFWEIIEPFSTLYTKRHGRSKISWSNVDMNSKVISLYSWLLSNNKQFPRELAISHLRMASLVQTDYVETGVHVDV